MRLQRVDPLGRQVGLAPRGRRSSSRGSAAAPRRWPRAARRSRRCRRSQSAMCCTPEPKASDRKRDDSVCWLCEALSTMRSAPSADCTTWLCTRPPGSSTSCCGRLRQVEQRGVEQQPGQHLLVVHRLRDVVDDGQAGVALAAVLAGRLELDVPDAAELALGIDEVEQAAAERRAPPGSPARPGRRPGGTAGRAAAARGRASRRHRRPSGRWRTPRCRA